MVQLSRSDGWAASAPASCSESLRALNVGALHGKRVLADTAEHARAGPRLDIPDAIVGYARPLLKSNLNACTIARCGPGPSLSPCNELEAPRLSTHAPRARASGDLSRTPRAAPKSPVMPHHGVQLDPVPSAGAYRYPRLRLYIRATRIRPCTPAMCRFKLKFI